jgi:hypothetical protein
MENGHARYFVKGRIWDRVKQIAALNPETAKLTA